MSEPIRPFDWSEESQRRWEIQIRLMTDALPVLISYVDAERRYQFINQTYTDWFGHAPEEIIGRHVREIIGEAAYAEVLPAMERVFAGEAFSFERLMPYKDGGSRFVSVKYVPDKDEKGSVKGFYALIEDITQRNQSEEKIKQLAERNREILESITDGFFALDRQWRFTYLNSQAEIILDRKQDDLIGKVIWDVYQIAGTEFERAYRRTADEGVVSTFTAYYPDHDRWYEVKTYPAPHGITVYFSNATERKRAEAEIKRLSDYNRNVLESITDPFFTLDREWRFTYMSRTGEELVFRKPDELLGKSLWDEFPGLIGSPFEKIYRAGMDDGITGTITDFFPDHDRFYEVTVYPSPDGVTVYFRDLTERKRSEANLVFLAEISQDIVKVTRVDEMMEIVGAKIGAFLNLSACLFAEINETADEVVINHAWHRPDTPSVKGVYRLAEFVTGEFQRAGRAGEIFVVSDTQADSRVDAAAYAAFNIGSFLSVPLLLNGEWKLQLTVNNSETHDWRADEIELIRELTVRIWTRLERARAEEALLESKARFDLVKDSAQVGFWFCDLPFDVLVWDDRVKEHFWLAPDAPVTIDTFYEQLHPDDRERTRQAIDKSIANKTQYEIEYRTVAGEGEQVKWIRAVGRTFYDAREGNPIRFDGITLDITERKRAEQAVHESEEKFRNLANSISQLAWIAEKNGEIFWYNQRWFEYTGTTIEEMQGWGWQAVHHPDYVEPVTEKFKRHIESGEIWEDTFPLRSRAGEYRWFLSRALPIRDKNGHVVRWFGTNTDVDEQRRLDQRNRFIIRIDEAVRPLESPEEITLMLARLLGEYLQADRCAYAEVEADEDHFYIPGDYTRGDTHSIVGHYSMADFGTEVLRLMRENKPYVVHDVNTDAQVTESDLAAYRLTAIQAVICVPLHKNNRFSACMAVHQKTPRRWLDEEVELVAFVANRFWESIERARIIKSLQESLSREKESRLQAEAANRLKDEFLATVSHELRTPLNAILGWSDMLKSGRATGDLAARASEAIYRSAKSQAQLIEDLLDVSRIITGKMKLDARPVQFASVVESAVNTIRPAADAKSIDVKMDLDCEPCLISGDAQRLQQVIWNLISNAVKFTPEGGRVEIRLETIDSHARLIVSDTGKGIEAEFLPFMFERFRQEDASSTRRHGGLGLGLAIVRHLVELHGGRIFVESAGENQGSTFTVELPLLLSRKQEERQSNGETQNLRGSLSEGFSGNQALKQLKGIRILLVDDELDTLEILDLTLSDAGADVRTASSAATAFEILQKWQPDVLVSDIAMPDEDGYSLINKVRELSTDKGGTIPAIAMTAYGRVEDRLRVLSSGFQSYVPKPAEPSELLNAIINLIG